MLAGKAEQSNSRSTSLRALLDIKGGVSQPRNAVIANVFYRLELIESYGTGIQKMMESYHGSGAEPAFVPAVSVVDPPQAIEGSAKVVVQ